MLFTPITIMRFRLFHITSNSILIVAKENKYTDVYAFHVHKNSLLAYH